VSGIGNTVKAEANQYVTSFPDPVSESENRIRRPVHRRRRARGRRSGASTRGSRGTSRRHGLTGTTRAWRRSAGQARAAPGS
jgi:hypothetical protein